MADVRTPTQPSTSSTPSQGRPTPRRPASERSRTSNGDPDGSQVGEQPPGRVEDPGHEGPTIKPQ